MKNTLHILTFLMCLLAGTGATDALAQGPAEADTVKIYFRQSKSDLDTTLHGNAATLRRLAGTAEALGADDTPLLLKSIHVTGAASPEGTAQYNYTLSQARAGRILDIFTDMVPLNSDSDKPVFTYMGRDWPGLRSMVEADLRTPARAEVLATVDEILAGGVADDEAIARLKGIDAGRAYRYMYQRMFPSLRWATVSYEYLPARLPLLPLMRPELHLESADVLEAAATMLGIVPLPPREKKGSPFYMGLKTNLLFDALALPNIGAEFYLGRNISIAGNWMYGWWDKNSLHRYWRAYGGDLAVRWWFGSAAHEKPLTGHHLGLYAGVVTYDFEFGGRGYMGGLPGKTLWDRCNRYAGIEYGYSLPVARRLNIDFTIGIGYLGGKYMKYDPKDGVYLWQSTNNLTWIGPTKAEISLVWLIGCGNYNAGKGGKR